MLLLLQLLLQQLLLLQLLLLLRVDQLGLQGIVRVAHMPLLLLPWPSNYTLWRPGRLLLERQVMLLLHLLQLELQRILLVIIGVGVVLR